MAGTGNGQSQDMPYSWQGPLEQARIPGWVRPLVIDLGCCGTYALQIGAPGYGLPGFDGSAYDLEPEQANVLVVAGRITSASGPFLRQLYDRLGSPQWVLAFGTCSASGSVFDTIPVEQVIPVDTVIPGCPPYPEVLLTELVRLRRRRT